MRDIATEDYNELYMVEINGIKPFSFVGTEDEAHVKRATVRNQFFKLSGSRILNINDIVDRLEFASTSDCRSKTVELRKLLKDAALVLDSLNDEILDNKQGEKWTR